MSMFRDSGPLTPREFQVLQQLGKGATYKMGAKAIGVEPCTFSDHVKTLYRKLNVNTAHGAVAQGFRLGMLK